MQNNLEKQIEAILFFKGEPVSLKKLADILKVSKEEIFEAISSLKNSLLSRGIVLLDNNDEYQLGTSPEYSELIENLQKEDLNKDLSKASLETLSIILYKNIVSRSEIDYIRGVNSTFSLRLLLVRGLIEKNIDPNDSRRYTYSPSFDLLSYLGISSVSELPDYDEVQNKLNGISIELKDLEQ